MDGSELSAMNLNLKYWKNADTVYSKFRGVYVLFKSDDQRHSLESGIFVSYAAVKMGKTDHVSSSCDCCP